VGIHIIKVLDNSAVIIQKAISECFVVSADVSVSVSRKHTVLIRFKCYVDPVSMLSSAAGGENGVQRWRVALNILYNTANSQQRWFSRLGAENLVISFP
jgi:hypothetical protein